MLLLHCGALTASILDEYSLSQVESNENMERALLSLHCFSLGCVDDNVEVSQHFFALKLSKEDLVRVLATIRLKYGDQRLSSKSDLARLGGTLDELVGEPPL